MYDPNYYTFACGIIFRSFPLKHLFTMTYLQHEKVNRRELAILEDYINSVDPNAFLTVINANEILGHGFKSLKKKVFSNY
jgi:hypothetical protein